MKSFRDQNGIAMVEATIGIVLLLFAVLMAGQLVLVFHGALAGHSAVVRAARTYAITGSKTSAWATFETQTQTSLGSLGWDGFDCSTNVGFAQCTVNVQVPSIVPGAGLFGGGGLAGPIPLPQTGSYPIGGNSGY